MRTERGISLLEMMAATACLAIIGVGAAGVSTSSSRAMTTNTILFECQLRANRCVESLQRHLRAASLGSLTTLPPGFENGQPFAEGVAADDLSWQSFTPTPDQPNALPELGGGLFAVTTAASENDPPNGLDDDLDGFVDDTDLRFQRPGAAAVTVARDVTDCSFTRDGRTLTISVQVRMRMPDGTPTFARATRAVEIRND